MKKTTAKAKKNKIETPKLPDYQAAALLQDFIHFAFVGGIASGKTFIGSHWVIKMLWDNPGKTGFIGANTYDQLSGATLQELFSWFNEYNIDYVIDRMPPKEWRAARRFKSYQNIISVRYYVNKKQVISYIHTRVMSGANNLRGITITWAWMDELAFAPINAHNVVLSRLRETKGYFRTLATTTTNGENWFYERYVKNPSPIYRTMHVETYRSVEAGIITQEFYDSLLSSYSKNLADQELFARYVNALEGRAYYSQSKKNQSSVFPWSGSIYPDPDLPIEVGCDFNYSPAPMCWTLSQKSPCGKFLHTFREYSQVECSTETMAERLAQDYGDFFIRIYGDASGARGTTGAGDTDYNIIADTLSDFGVTFSINTTLANPKVRDRVENTNRMLCDASGQVSYTYNPDSCPLLDADFRGVGWTQKGKLTGNGNVLLTHSSDSLGYKIWKLFPPLQRTTAISRVASQNIKDISSAV